MKKSKKTTPDNLNDLLSLIVSKIILTTMTLLNKVDPKPLPKKDWRERLSEKQQKNVIRKRK